MNKKTSTNAWQQYELEIFNLFRSTGYRCEQNVVLKGARGKHQIDVLLSMHDSLQDHFWIIECKERSRSISKDIVQSLKTVIDDTGADHGYLISENGFQKGTVEMARKMNITLTSYAYLKEKFLTDQLSPLHTQSRVYFSRIESCDDLGNDDYETRIEIMSESNNIAQDIVEIHIFHEHNLHWILSKPECLNLLKKYDSFQISIPWDIPNLNLEKEKISFIGFRLTGRLTTGEKIWGAYQVVFRTLHGPVYTNIYVPTPK